MGEALVVFNAGSTSLKFAAYRMDAGDALPLLRRGRIDGLRSISRFTAEDASGKAMETRTWEHAQALDHKGAMQFVISWLEAGSGGIKVAAAGHRVLLGGVRFEAPIRIDGDVLDYLDSLSAMEPSHQPFNVQGARAFAEAFPGLPQVACFDSAFHRTMPEVAQTYALPRRMRDAGVRHWGYHGLSYDYISRRLAFYAPTARRVIVAHLGGGASLCALLDGRSIETTMGFSALSGLPMETRSGDMPPEVLLYLLRSKQLDIAGLEEMLYDRSGLLGLSGLSGDMQKLQETTEPAAVAAVDHFVYAMTKYVGAYTCLLGGLDALVFTGGIGENSAPVRAALCAKLGWLGLEVDERANADDGPAISTPDSRVAVWVVSTNEELMIAQHTLALLSPC